VDGRSNQELVTAAKAGDEAALEALLTRYQPNIYRFGMKMCRHPQDAEDVLQDTLLTAARSIADFRGASSITSWLYAIARSFCIKKRRKSKFAPAQEQSLEQLAGPDLNVADSNLAPDEAVFGGELRVALEDALASLDEDEREVILLRDVEGLRARDVAEVLEISVPAMKSRLHRARVRVRGLLGPALGEVLPPRPECPDIATLFSKHLEGDISTELCAEMERHLQGCKPCEATCDSLKQTLSMCSQLPAAPLPAPLADSVRTSLRDFLQTTKSVS
jgi:RNA polymerase sigma-70 factor (ECF subfamily)